MQNSTYIFELSKAMKLLNNKQVMTFQTLRYQAANTLTLQSIGHVIGEPAINIKKGDVLMWNYGSKETVLEIVKETKAFITILSEGEYGYKGERRLKKDRLVCILKK